MTSKSVPVGMWLGRKNAPAMADWTGLCLLTARPIHGMS